MNVSLGTLAVLGPSRSDISADARTDSEKAGSFCFSLRRLREHDSGQPWIKTWSAELFFGVLILLNAIVMGIGIEFSLRGNQTGADIIFVIEMFFLVVFIVELGLRIQADGCAFFSLHNFSGLFDLAIIAGSVMEVILALAGAGSGALAAVGAMRVLRLLRIGRVARLLHVCKPLWLLLASLLEALQAVFSVFCLLFILLYICSLVLCLELGHLPDLQKYFGSVGSSMYTHFMIVTLEGFPSVAKAAGEQCWIWYFYIVLVVVCFNVVLLNLVTGIVLEHVTRCGADEDRFLSQEASKFVEVLHNMFHWFHIRPSLAKVCICGAAYSDGDALTCEACGEGRRQGIDFEKWRDEIIPNPSIREAMHIMDICLNVEDWQLWQAIDKEGLGVLSTDQFAMSLLRLRGTKDKLHSLLVQGDLLQGMRRESLRLEDAEQKLCAIGKHAVNRFENDQRARFLELQREVAALPTKREENAAAARKALSLDSAPVPDEVGTLLKQMDATTVQAATALSHLKEELVASRKRVAALKERVLPLRREALGLEIMKGILRVRVFSSKEVAGQEVEGKAVKGFVVKLSVGEQERRSSSSERVWNPSWDDIFELHIDLRDKSQCLLTMQICGSYEDVEELVPLGWCNLDLATLPRHESLLCTHPLQSGPSGGLFTGAELEYEVELFPTEPAEKQGKQQADRETRTPLCCLQPRPQTAHVVEDAAPAPPAEPKDGKCPTM
mmetsp:Transcript_2189/g.4612  ORF Transcript_2189/g.4612 Transcript_2189/m.4612 type:complete len:725 (+) Transcript_2189:143-2317(+)